MAAEVDNFNLPLVPVALVEADAAGAAAAPTSDRALVRVDLPAGAADALARGMVGQ